jgi:hypothetical protein
MTEIEKRQQRTVFKEWKKRAMKTVTPLLIDFFKKQPADPIHTEMEWAYKVGYIIQSLNNPYYDILDAANDKRLDEDSIIAVRCLLELYVEDFFKYMKTDFVIPSN